MYHLLELWVLSILQSIIWCRNDCMFHRICKWRICASCKSDSFINTQDQQIVSLFHIHTQNTHGFYQIKICMSCCLLYENIKNKNMSSFSYFNYFWQRAHVSCKCFFQWGTLLLSLLQNLFGFIAIKYLKVSFRETVTDMTISTWQNRLKYSKPYLKMTLSYGKWFNMLIVYGFYSWHWLNRETFAFKRGNF